MRGSNNISFTPSSETRYSSGIGYVVLPDNSKISREEYIIDCYKNSWVSLYIEGEGIKDRVNCDVNTFNWIYFPEKVGQYGTAIVWVFDQIKGIIYATSTLPGGSNYEHANEHDFRFIRRYKDSFVEIRGNPKSNKMNFVVHSIEGSELNISVTDRSKKSKFNILVNGDLYVKTNKKTNFFSHESFEVEVQSEEEEENKSKFSIYEESIREQSNTRTLTIWEKLIVKLSSISNPLRKKTSILDMSPEKSMFKTDRFIINTGKEKMVLGDSLVHFLEEFVIEVSNIQVATPMGLMPIMNKRKIAAFTMKLRKLLSRHGFLS